MADQYHLKKKQRMQIYYRRVAAGMTGGIAALGSMGFLAMGLPGMGIGLGVAVGIIAATLAVAGIMKAVKAYKLNNSGKLPAPKELKDIAKKELEVHVDAAQKGLDAAVDNMDGLTSSQKEKLKSESKEYCKKTAEKHLNRQVRDIEQDLDNPAAMDQRLRNSDNGESPAQKARGDIEDVFTEQFVEQPSLISPKVQQGIVDGALKEAAKPTMSKTANSDFEKGMENALAKEPSAPPMEPKGVESTASKVQEQDQTNKGPSPHK